MCNRLSWSWLFIANGLALGNKINNKKEKTIVMISDGGVEGTTWEAAMFATAKKLNNLTLIIDYNKWQVTGRSKRYNIKPLDKKFKSFGWDTFTIDGTFLNR